MKTSVKTAILAGAVLVTAGVAATVKAQFPLPPQPNGACKFKDGTCQVTPQNICKLAKGSWQGPGTECPTNADCKVEN